MSDGGAGAVWPDALDVGGLEGDDLALAGGAEDLLQAVDGLGVVLCAGVGALVARVQLEVLAVVVEAALELLLAELALVQLDILRITVGTILICVNTLCLH